MMETEVVRKREWLTKQQFLDLLGGRGRKELGQLDECVRSGRLEVGGGQPSRRPAIRLPNRLVLPEIGRRSLWCWICIVGLPGAGIGAARVADTSAVVGRRGHRTVHARSCVFDRDIYWIHFGPDARSRGRDLRNLSALVLLRCAALAPAFPAETVGGDGPPGESHWYRSRCYCGRWVQRGWFCAEGSLDCCWLSSVEDVTLRVRIFRRVYEEKS